MRPARAAVQRVVDLASSLLSALAILMPEKNEMRVRRCDATEHASVTLSRFRTTGENVSFCGQTTMSQLRLRKAPLAHCQRVTMLQEWNICCGLDVVGRRKRNDSPSLAIKRMMQSITDEYGTVGRFVCALTPRNTVAVA